MLKKNHGALPTLKNTKKNDALQHQLFFHYLNHSYKDIPNSKAKSSKKVIEGIIESFSNNYRPEKYFRISDGSKENLHENSKDDSLQDLRSIAHIAVWEAAYKYIWGVDKKIKNQVIHINYNYSFQFCQFASSHVKFKLRTYLRKLNLDRVCGYAPDSDDIRKIYSKLPKIKYKKGSIDNEDYKALSDENKNIEIEDVKSLDQLITFKTISGDEERSDEEGNSIDNWNYLSKSNEALTCNNNLDGNCIEKLTQDNLICIEFEKLKKEFCENLSFRDKKILMNTKLFEFNNSKKSLTLSELGKEFNISSERVRIISLKKFEEFKNFLIINKKRLGR